MGVVESALTALRALRVQPRYRLRSPRDGGLFMLLPVGIDRLEIGPVHAVDSRPPVRDILTIRYP